MNVLDFIAKNFESIAGIIMAVIALYKGFKLAEDKAAATGKINKMQIIKQLVPEIHILVSKSAKFTDTKKDDAFLEMMEKGLKALGVELDDEEREGIKVLGAAEHNIAKVADSLGKPDEA